MTKSEEGTQSITEKELKRYVELNKQKKEIDAEMKYLKKGFNEFLDEKNGKGQKGEFQCGDYKVQRQVRSSINYQEESTVQKLEELNLEDCIIIAKRPDTEKLEAAFRLGLADESAFEDFKKTKTTQAIVVKESL